ncbi:histidine ammonia-lyase [Escherichia coli]|nr:histidine ammonia-lyase [Escherichia coli]
MTVALSKSTKAMFTAYRQVVPFVSQDRVFTPDIAASQKFLEGYAINQKIKSLLIVYHNIHRYDK